MIWMDGHVLGGNIRRVGKSFTGKPRYCLFIIDTSCEYLLHMYVRTGKKKIMNQKEQKTSI